MPDCIPKENQKCTTVVCGYKEHWTNVTFVADYGICQNKKFEANGKICRCEECDTFDRCNYIIGSPSFECNEDGSHCRQIDAMWPKPDVIITPEPNTTKAPKSPSTRALPKPKILKPVKEPNSAICHFYGIQILMVIIIGVGIGFNFIILI